MDEAIPMESQIWVCKEGLRLVDYSKNEEGDDGPVEVVRVQLREFESLEVGSQALEDLVDSVDSSLEVPLHFPI